MNVILHYPKEPEAITALSNKAAAVHAQAIAAYIGSLSCPKEQKLTLLNEVLKNNPAKTGKPP